MSFHKGFSRDSCRPGPGALHRWVVHAAAAADLDSEGDGWEQFTLSQPLHGRTEGGTIGNSPFQGLFPSELRVQKENAIAQRGKGKNRTSPFPASRPFLVEETFRVRPGSSGVGLAWCIRYLLVLDLGQRGGVVREVLKIGVDQHPCRLNQLVTWFGQHCHSLKTRNLGDFIPGTPAI